MFYTVVTEDDYYIVLGDNVNLNDLKETFRNNLPKGQAKCFRQKNNVTALIMPDLILAEKKIEEKTL